MMEATGTVSKVEDASDEAEFQVGERTNGAKVFESTSKRPSYFDTNGTPCRYDEPSDAIPVIRRIPKNQGNNATYISQRRSKGPKDGTLTALVEYNPTLLPSHLILIQYCLTISLVDTMKIFLMKRLTKSSIYLLQEAQILTTVAAARGVGKFVFDSCAI